MPSHYALPLTLLTASEVLAMQAFYTLQENSLCNLQGLPLVVLCIMSVCFHCSDKPAEAVVSTSASQPVLSGVSTLFDPLQGQLGKAVNIATQSQCNAFSSIIVTY